MSTDFHKPGKRPQSHPEEIANTLSHALGLLAAVIATPFLIASAVSQNDLAFVIGVSIFCATVIILYLCSSLYHLMPQGQAKRVFNIIDHSAIYLLIAGTYTPFTLGALRGGWGWSLLSIIWGLAVMGVLLKAFSRLSHPVLSVGLYLLMGWLIVVAIHPLLTNVPAAGIWWLAAGGASYTLGVVFFALGSKIIFSHFIWHLFVLMGTACHVVAVFAYGS